MDFSVKKNVLIAERLSVEFSATFSNVFNHNQLSDPYLILGDSKDRGGLGGLSSIYNDQTAQANKPRAMEFGLRFTF